MTISADELKAALGISRRQVTRYVDAGCPYERVGNGKRAPLAFDLAAVKAWMHKTARTGEPSVHPVPGISLADGEASGDEGAPVEDLTRLTRIVNLEVKRWEVEKRKRIEAEASGALVPLDEVKRAWGAQVEVVHARFRTLPAVLAARVVGKEYDEAHEIIETELRSVLTSFAVEELAV